MVKFGSTDADTWVFIKYCMNRQKANIINKKIFDE